MSAQQVEVNTISAAFAGMSPKVRALHETVLQRHVPSGPEREAAVASLPANDSCANIAAALAQAVDLCVGCDALLLLLSHSLAVLRYRTHGGAGDSVVVFVVQAGETNVFDQRLLEFALLSMFQIRVLRRTLAEVCSPQQK